MSPTGGGLTRLLIDLDLLCPSVTLVKRVFVLHRAALRFRLQLSSRRIAARSARGSRRRSRVPGACAPRSRRRLRRPPLSQGRAGGWPEADHRSGSDHRPPRVQHGERRPPGLQGHGLSTGRPLRKSGRLPQSVPADHAHEAPRPERRGRPGARGSGRLDARAGGVRGPRGARRSAVTASAGCSIVPSGYSAATRSSSSCSVISAGTRKPTTRGSSTSRRPFACRSSRPAACASRRRRSGRSSTC